jgi:hypothetical protein
MPYCDRSSVLTPFVYCNTKLVFSSLIPCTFLCPFLLVHNMVLTFVNHHFVSVSCNRILSHSVHVLIYFIIRLTSNMSAILIRSLLFRLLSYLRFIIHSFIHLVVCLTTGPKPLPKRALHTVRSRASSFKWKYPLLSLRSSSSFLRLFPRLPVTYISPFIFPSVTRCRRQFLRKMWPIQFAFRLRISCRIFSCFLN